jgi:prepilin-type N-terminal cleavage/methylation domain-containing protein
MKRKSQAPGFTLVELLVVIVILGALATIAFPVFATARENARRAACKSNLHQIGIALSLYRADYDGMDPAKGLRLSHSQLGLPYPSSLTVFYRDYVKNREVLFCPSFSQDRRPWASSYSGDFLVCELTDPALDWEGAAAARGPDYPVAVCQDHNGPRVDLNMRRSSDVLYYHVLRIDGRVTVKKHRVSEDNGGPFFW